MTLYKKSKIGGIHVNNLRFSNDIDLIFPGSEI